MVSVTVFFLSQRTRKDCQFPTRSDCFDFEREISPSILVHFSFLLPCDHVWKQSFVKSSRRCDIFQLERPGKREKDDTLGCQERGRWCRCCCLMTLIMTQSEQCYDTMTLLWFLKRHSQSESLFPLTVRRNELSLMTCKETGDPLRNGKEDRQPERDRQFCCVCHTQQLVWSLFPWPPAIYIVRESNCVGRSCSVSRFVPGSLWF